MSIMSTQNGQGLDELAPGRRVICAAPWPRTRCSIVDLAVRRPGLSAYTLVCICAHALMCRSVSGDSQLYSPSSRGRPSVRQPPSGRAEVRPLLMILDQQIWMDIRRSSRCTTPRSLPKWRSPRECGSTIGQSRSTWRRMRGILARDVELKARVDPGLPHMCQALGQLAAVCRSQRLICASSNRCGIGVTRIRFTATLIQPVVTLPKHSSNDSFQGSRRLE